MTFAGTFFSRIFFQHLVYQFSQSSVSGPKKPVSLCHGVVCSWSSSITDLFDVNGFFMKTLLRVLNLSAKFEKF